jgi:glycosyltransferase involved in cell wall biosynthesis
MRAWNVCTELDPSLAGLYRGIVDFARALDAPVISFCRRRSGADFAPDVPVKRVACGPNPPGYPCLFVGQSAAESADRIVGDADLLIVHSLFRGHVAWAARHASRSGTRLWSVPHGCLDPWGLKQRGLLKRAWLAAYGARFLEQASVTLFSTHREREKARPWISSGETTVIPWPVELPDVSDREAARHRFRQRLSIPESATILLSAARLHSMKRPLETVAAFCATDSRYAHLVMVGMDGDITASQVAGAVPAGHRNQVHVPGPMHGLDLRDAWLAADGFISLSYRENFGYSFAEALSYGLPAIVSPGHDLAWDLPMDGSGRWPYGWLLPDDHPRSATGAIAEFIRCHRAAGRDRIESAPPWSSARPWVAEQLAPERFRERLLRL